MFYIILSAYTQEKKCGVAYGEKLEINYNHFSRDRVVYQYYMISRAHIIKKIVVYNTSKFHSMTQL